VKLTKAWAYAHAKIYAYVYSNIRGTSLVALNLVNYYAIYGHNFGNNDVNRIGDVITSTVVSAIDQNNVEITIKHGHKRQPYKNFLIINNIIPNSHQNQTQCLQSKRDTFENNKKITRTRLT